MIDPYFNRPEVSNSDLTELNKYFMARDQIMDYENALRFGTLVDAMITELEKVNVYKRTVEDYIYKPEEMELAKAMKRAFYQDELCKRFADMATYQQVFSGVVKLNYGSFEFELLMRCKYDLFMKQLGYGGDIKSTAATTQKQFEDSIYHFDYDRSRVVYMQLSGAPKDIIIGISKVNCKIFKVYIDRFSKIYQSGLEKFQDTGFKYWSLFEGFNPWVLTKEKQFA